MATMRAVQIPEPGGDLELVERGLPEPGPGEVRIRVDACGICHSDVFGKEGAFPGIAPMVETFPLEEADMAAGRGGAGYLQRPPAYILY